MDINVKTQQVVSQEDIALLKQQIQDVRSENLSTWFTILGIIITVLLGVVWFIVWNFKSKAKEELIEIRRIRDIVEEEKDKALENIRELNKDVDKTLKKIEDKWAYTIKKLIIEWNRQRKISELFEKGVKSQDKKEYEKAMDYYDEVIKIDKKSNIAYNNKWIVFAELKQYEKALECYEDAIKINPNLSEPYNNKWCAYFELWEKTVNKKYLLLAMEEYQKALKLNPKGKEIQENIEEWKEALEKLKSEEKNKITWNR